MDKERIKSILTDLRHIFSNEESDLLCKEYTLLNDAEFLEHYVEGLTDTKKCIVDYQKELRNLIKKEV